MGDVGFVAADTCDPDTVGTVLVADQQDVLEVNVDATGETTVAFSFGDKRPLFEMELGEFRSLLGEAEKRANEWRDALLKDGVWR